MGVVDFPLSYLSLCKYFGFQQSRGGFDTKSTMEKAHSKEEELAGIWGITFEHKSAQRPPA